MLGEAATAAVHAAVTGGVVVASSLWCQYEGCGASFKNAAKLARHTRTHTGEVRVAASACCLHTSINSCTVDSARVSYVTARTVTVTRPRQGHVIELLGVQYCGSHRGVLKAESRAGPAQDLRFSDRRACVSACCAVP